MAVTDAASEAAEEKERFKKWREGLTVMEGGEGKSEEWWFESFREVEKEFGRESD